MCTVAKGERATSVSAHACSALSVCVLWCMWSHTSFLARGEIARPSPLAERSSCYTPTLRVDTHTPTAGRDHIHLRSTLSHLPLFHRPFRGARPTKDPGAPLLSAVYVCPSPWMPLGSGTARIRKTQRLTGRMENAWSQTLKTSCIKTLHLAGTPQNSKRRKNGQNPKQP